MELKNYKLFQLRTMLKKSIEEEDYELSAKIRDEIKHKEEFGDDVNEEERVELEFDENAQPLGVAFIPGIMQNIMLGIVQENVNYEEDIDDEEHYEHQNEYLELEPKDIIFNVGVMKEELRKEYDGYTPTILVTITPTKYFEEEGCAYDQGCCGEVNRILENLGLVEIMESAFEIDDEEKTTPEEVYKKLIDAGFINSPEFNDFIDSCGGEENDYVSFTCNTNDKK